jgi:hypothetical protein
MDKTHEEASTFGTHRTLFGSSSQECFGDKVLHFVRLKASGPHTEDDLPAVMSAEGSRYVFLGTANRIASLIAVKPQGEQGCHIRNWGEAVSQGIQVCWLR